MFFYNEGDSEVSQIQTPSIVTEGLQLHVDAGDTNSYPGSGTTWYDLSGNSYNGTLVNGAAYSNNAGGTILFDAINDYVNFGDLSNFNFVGNSSFSISCFFNAPLYTLSTSYQHSIISKYHYLNNQGWILYLVDYSTDGSSLSLRFEFGKSTRYVIKYLNGNDFYGNWHHVCAVVAPNEHMKLYLDSVDVSSYDATSIVNTTVVSPSGIPMMIGKRNDFSPNANYKGEVANMQIYNRALSEAEVLQNFNATKNRFGL